MYWADNDLTKKEDEVMDSSIEDFYR